MKRDYQVTPNNAPKSSQVSVEAQDEQHKHKNNEKTITSPERSSSDRSSSMSSTGSGDIIKTSTSSTSPSASPSPSPSPSPSSSSSSYSTSRHSSGHTIGSEVDDSQHHHSEDLEMEQENNNVEQFCSLTEEETQQENQQQSMQEEEKKFPPTNSTVIEICHHHSNLNNDKSNKIVEAQREVIKINENIILANSQQHQQENNSRNVDQAAKITDSESPLTRHLFLSSTDSSSSPIMSAKKQNSNKGQPVDHGFSISWHKLDFVRESKWYKLASERKPILSSLSGQIKSGELTAVLGPSGAGKSTFIDCLIGKHERGLSGRTQVTFADEKIESERRRRRQPLKIALIPQKDHLLERLTVMETLMFASRIKNAHLKYEEEEEDCGDDDDYDDAAGYDNEAAEFEVGVAGKVGVALTKTKRGRKEKQARRPFDHQANVQRVLTQLQLSSCASLRCNKLSGGQYKRVSIGQELLSRPDLMILDEPTSGLDSVTCFNTVRALRELIESSPYPMAIVATIHQPDIEVFQLFHKTYVLATGGRAIFEGPSEEIFPTLDLAMKLVENRRQQWVADPHLSEHERKRAHAKATVDGSSTSLAKLEELKAQLEGERRLISTNPARLIVEVAAQQYGFEISNVLAELQSRRHEPCGAIQQQAANSTLNSLSATTNAGSSNSATDLSSIQTEMTRAESRLTMSCSSSSLHQVALESLSELRPMPDQKPAAPQYIPPPNKRSRRVQFMDPLLKMKVKSNSASSGDSNRNNNNNNTHRGPFMVWWKHLWCHMQRSWINILRDPMLFTVQLALHILVPLLISYSFQSQYGNQADACPRVGELDLVHEAYRQNGTILDDLNRELRLVFENIGYLFFQIYVIIFAAVCVTSLTYPLVMHVLLKEYRNGWYSISSYFFGQTLADLPVPTFNVVLAMAISYHLTGQPNSPYMWRFIAVALLTTLATLVAQTMGLMFGALLMNLPQSAVFVAPASTAPLVVVSGFLLRISSLPPLLQYLSKLSYFTYLLNGVIVARYGFNRCPCSEDNFVVEETHKVPYQARTMIDIWIESFAGELGGGGQNLNSSASAAAAAAAANSIYNITTGAEAAAGAANITTTALAVANDLITTTITPTIETAIGPAHPVDLVGKLVTTISEAKTFGHQLDQCHQVKPFAMLDYKLEDYDLYVCLVALALMLFLFRWATYMVLSWKISSVL